MPELVIKFQKYIGESRFDWDTFEFEMATSAADVRMLVEWEQYLGQTVDSICLEMGTCFGGSTFDGTEIYNYLQGLGIPVRTRILSFAASMATIVMLTGDVCEIDASASLMVHGPSCDSSGTVQDLTSSLKGLTDARQALRDIYVARTGQPIEVVEEWMSKDTFFTAQEALEAGLVTKVIPIAPKAAPVLTDAQASARRAKYAGIVARAERRAAVRTAVPTPKAKTAARAAAPIPRPMATKNSKTAGAAVRKPAAAGKQPAAPTAQQKAAQAAVAAYAKSMGVTIKMEGEAATAEAEEPTAEVVATTLANGNGTLYSDGEPAVGSAVFNDEALTEPTDDGLYGTEDGRDITITDGAIESIVDTPSAEAEAPADIAALVTAAVTEGLKPFTERLNTIEARFNKAVPSLPKAKGGNGSQVADPKASGKPQAKSLLKGASTQRTA